jgi:hypothetical protein
MASSLYVESEVEVYLYTLAFDHLRAMAFDPEESREMISALAKPSS